MKLLVTPKLLIVCVLASTSAYADVTENQLKEVVHLLDFIKKSDCIINRNGTDHTAEKGVVHIENKYKYFKDKIKRTEDFIKYSATKSTMSGKYYTVTCPEKEMIKTQDWLLTELKTHRSK